MKNGLSEKVQRALTGFAAGVMTAASVWSLLLPAIDRSAEMNSLSFVPAVAGFWIGIVFLMALDKVIPRICSKNKTHGAVDSSIQKTRMLILAVTLHNLPEGMAVGAAFAGYMSGDIHITLAAAFALSVGISIQNFPEGAIISMPLNAAGVKKSKAFIYGVLSGVIEPIGAALTIIAAGLVVPVLPLMLSFAAGAMIYVAVKELIPELSKKNSPNFGTVFFSLGFTVMMALDVALG